MPFNMNADLRRMLPAALLLLFAILAPTFCILWFMNAAVQNERLAVRQRLHDVYLAELTLRQKRLDDRWENVLEALSLSSTLAPPAAFEAALHSGASTVLIFRDGRLAYPQTGALQPERLQEPSKLLFDIESLPPNDFRRAGLSQQLAATLQDYSAPLPSTQRLFLMQRLHDLTGADLPTLPAERLALAIAEAPGPAAFLSPAASGIHPIAGLPGYFFVVAPARDAVALWSTESLLRQLDTIVDPAPANTTLSLAIAPPPDAFLTLPAGKYFPNLTLALNLSGPDPFAAAARRQELTYLWTGSLAIASIALVALLLGLYLHRQLQITRLKNDLIATVSHELKTPLSSMRVLIDTLLEDRVPSPELQRDYLALIARENTRLSRLIDNFLTFSRMERRKIAFSFQPLNARTIAQSAIDAMGERGTAITLDAPADLALTGDADALITLLLNLLDNAWKYSPADKHITLSAAPVPGNQIEFAIADTGIGIARRHHQRIFHRFYQVDQHLTRNTPGCGLGLAIVKFIADAHQATISLTSHPGQGSTFRIRFPAAPIPARASPARDHDDAATSPPEPAAHA